MNRSHYSPGNLGLFGLTMFHSTGKMVWWCGGDCEKYLKENQANILWTIIDFNKYDIISQFWHSSSFWYLGSLWMFEGLYFYLKFFHVF